MTGSAEVIRGDALALDIRDQSVDLIVTSPPYFGLRSYQDGGEHYTGQIGAEPTPAEFVDALIAATREMVRVLKPSGSIWVNLGDKYASSGGHGAGATSQRVTRSQYVEQVGRAERNATGVPAKSLVGVPWRYAIRCIDELGLILRAEIIWSKPNGLPESVTDRVRRSHETWFHFTTQPRYYSAVDEVREPLSNNAPAVTMRRVRAERADGAREIVYDGAGSRTDTTRLEVGQAHPLGKLPGSVWTIPTQPLKVPARLGIDHFAAFPMEWPRRIIKGWSPAEVCSACGEGRRPVAERTKNILTGSFGTDMAGHGQDGRSGQRAETTAVITGYTCACPDTTAPSTPGVVLDPFGGTGTTALVAKALGRRGISNDLSSDYCRLAHWRTNDPGELARAMQVEKPDAIHIDQLDLFGEAS